MLPIARMKSGSTLDICSQLQHIVRLMAMYMSLSIIATLTVSANTSSGYDEAVCPLGFEVSPEGYCVCADPSGFPFGEQVQCNVESTSDCAVTYSTVTLGHCVTLDANNVSEIVAGPCFQAVVNFSSPVFWPGNGSGKHLVLPTDPTKLQDYFCSDSHLSGTLCAKCSNNTAIDINSIEMECIPRTRCSNISWLWLTLELFLPLTLFIALFSYFQFNLTSPNLYIVIVISQFIGTPMNIISMKWGVTKGFSHTMTWMVDSYTILYSTWNLDIGRYLLPSLCVIQPLGRMQALAIQYVTAFYPLLLIFLAILCSRINLYHANVCGVLSRCLPGAGKVTLASAWCSSPRLPTVKTLATFLLLSYNKLVRVSIYLLLPQPIYDVSGSVVRYVLFFDTSVDYFSDTHLPYALLALTIVALFNVLPTSLLLFYQLPRFQRVLYWLNLHQHGLVAFVDVFQGNYKNRSCHKRDYRFFAGIYFILHSLIAIFCCLEVNGEMFITLDIIVANAMTVALFLCQPFKAQHHNNFNAFAFVYISIMLAIYLRMKTIVGKTTTEYSVLASIAFLSTFWPATYIAFSAAKSLWQKCRIGTRFPSLSRRSQNNEELHVLDDTDDAADPFLLGESFPDRVLQPDDYKCENNTICKSQALEDRCTA